MSGVRHSAQVQPLLLEDGNALQDSARIRNNSGLGHPLHVVDKKRLDTQARTTVTGTIYGTTTLGATGEETHVLSGMRRQSSSRLHD